MNVRSKRLAAVREMRELLDQVEAIDHITSSEDQRHILDMLNQARAKLRRAAETVTDWEDLT